MQENENNDMSFSDQNLDIIDENENNESETIIETEKLFTPQRMEGESYIDYRERRLVANYKLHQLAKGKLIWNSRPEPSSKGNTFRKVA